MTASQNDDHKPVHIYQHNGRYNIAVNRHRLVDWRKLSPSDPRVPVLKALATPKPGEITVELSITEVDWLKQKYLTEQGQKRLRHLHDEFKHQPSPKD